MHRLRTLAATSVVTLATLALANVPRAPAPAPAGPGVSIVPLWLAVTLGGFGVLVARSLRRRARGQPGGGGGLLAGGGLAVLVASVATSLWTGGRRFPDWGQLVVYLGWVGLFLAALPWMILVARLALDRRAARPRA